MTLLPERIVPTKTYPFSDIRHLLGSVIRQEGIVHKGDFAVTQRAAGANLSVDVAAGAAYVQGDDVARQGVYEVINDAAINVLIGVNGSGNPRVDTIALQVNDSSVASLSDDPQIVVLQGTPTPSATLGNLLGKAALPNTCLPLAYVLVAYSASAILNANIGYLYDPGRPSLGANAGAPAQYAHGRPVDYTPFAALGANAQNIPNASFTKVGLPNVSLDNDAMAQGASQLTVKTPGIWTVGGQIAFVNGAGSTRVLLIAVNALDYANVSVPPVSGAPTRLTTAMTTRFGYGDLVELDAYQNSGGALAVEIGEVSSQLSAIWVGN